MQIWTLRASACGALARLRDRLCSFAAAVLAALAGTGCLFAPEVGVIPVGPEQVRADLDANALTGTGLSSVTREVLRLFDLDRRYDQDPEAAIRALHEVARTEAQRSIRFALAETCYQTAKRRTDRRWYLGAAAYAYLYLFEDADPEPPNPFDRRFRWACDIYNQGLLRACTSEDGERFEFVPGTRALPVGSLEVRVDRSKFPWSPEDFSTFLPADRFRVRGLAVRLRDSGLGVPLLCFAPERSGEESESGRLRTRAAEAPATAFLRIEGGLEQLGNGTAGELELFSGFDSTSVEVAGTRVPLETDLSAAIAHALDRPAIWRFSLFGLFSGEDPERTNKLFVLRPYQPGRIPVVLVHGTASSPAYWADLFNSIMRDPELRRSVQFWFFRYASGNPILYSAADLREVLGEAIATFDPDGDDPALRRMVLVGHSQGGLLARLMTVDGSLAWLEEVSGRALESFHFDGAQRALLERTLEFDPLPYVKRVVFVSTPHRGSFLARRWFAGLIDGFISLPREVSALSRRVFADEARLPKELRGRRMTSLDNMDPGSPLLERLVREPLESGVAFHSIISIGNADPDDPDELAEADDGVVAYESAHLEGVESEALVRSGHSCQSEPATIRELRRILLEHVRAVP